MKLSELNNIELKAFRMGLSLSVAEASEIAGVSKRSFQYWESGRYKIPDEWISKCWDISAHYNLLFEKMSEDIESFKDKNPRLKTEDIEEYKKWVKTRNKLILPFFNSFDDYCKITNYDSVLHWRMYQSIVSHFFSIGEIEGIDDKSIIPEYFSINSWLAGDYDYDKE